MPSKEKRRGKVQGTCCGLQGMVFGPVIPSWIIQLLCMSIWLSSSLPPQSEREALPTLQHLLRSCFMPHRCFSSVWAFFFVHWHLCNRGGKIFSLSSPQNVEIFKEEVGGRLAPPASFPYCCRSLAAHHKMSPHAHCIVALSPLYVLPFFFPLKLFHIANLAIISCCLNYISSLWSYISRLK